MNRARPSFLALRKALPQPRRRTLAAQAWLAVAVLLGPPAWAAAAPDSAPPGTGGDGCSVLVRLYRSLHDAAGVPPAERERLADRILNACAVVDIELLRATTLDGAAVLELPAAAALTPDARP